MSRAAMTAGPEPAGAAAAPPEAEEPAAEAEAEEPAAAEAEPPATEPDGLTAAEAVQIERSLAVGRLAGTVEAGQAMGPDELRGLCDTFSVIKHAQWAALAAVNQQHRWRDTDRITARDLAMAMQMLGDESLSDAEVAVGCRWMAVTVGRG